MPRPLHKIAPLFRSALSSYRNKVTPCVIIMGSSELRNSVIEQFPKISKKTGIESVLQITNGGNTIESMVQVPLNRFVGTAKHLCLNPVNKEKIHNFVNEFLTNDEDFSYAEVSDFVAKIKDHHLEAIGEIDLKLKKLISALRDSIDPEQCNRDEFLANKALFDHFKKENCVTIAQPKSYKKEGETFTNPEDQQKTNITEFVRHNDELNKVIEEIEVPFIGFITVDDKILAPFVKQEISAANPDRDIALFHLCDNEVRPRDDTYDNSPNPEEQQELEELLRKTIKSQKVDLEIPLREEESSKHLSNTIKTDGFTMQEIVRSITEITNRFSQELAAESQINEQDFSR